jgi:2-oxoglutarate ferredoxin oxidoreductase subunit alpha
MAAVIEQDPKVDIAVVAYGSSDGAVREALDILQAHGLKANYMRVRAFLEEHDVCFVVEQNRDGQLRSLLTLETGVSGARLRSVLSYGGFPLSAQTVVDSISAQTGE